MTRPVEEHLAEIEAEIRRLVPDTIDAGWLREAIGEPRGPLSPQAAARFLAPAADLLRRGESAGGRC